MSSALFDYEWQFLVQMIMRITYCENYTEACETLLRQLRTLIPYNSAIAFADALVADINFSLGAKLRDLLGRKPLGDTLGRP